MRYVTNASSEAVGAALAGANALAQTKNFDGIQVGWGFNLVKRGFERHSNGATLGFSDKAVISFGATIGLIEVDRRSSGSVSLGSKNIDKFYFEPGVAAFENALVYGKFGITKST